MIKTPAEIEKENEELLKKDLKDNWDRLQEYLTDAITNAIRRGEKYLYCFHLWVPLDFVGRTESKSAQCIYEELLEQDQYWEMYKPKKFLSFVKDRIPASYKVSYEAYGPIEKMKYDEWDEEKEGWFRVKKIHKVSWDQLNVSFISELIPVSTDYWITFIQKYFLKLPDSDLRREFASGMPWTRYGLVLRWD